MNKYEQTEYVQRSRKNFEAKRAEIFSSVRVTRVDKSRINQYRIKYELSSLTEAITHLLDNQK